MPDLGGSGTFCFISDWTRTWAEQHSRWRFPVSTVVYSGIDHGDFPVAAAPPDQPWRWRLLYVGRIDPRKGLDTAIHALAALPDEATLTFDGGGDAAYRNELVVLAERLGVSARVRWQRSDRAALRDCYAAADVLVFPPHWAEPFGLVPVEAMACGTPVVATGTGGSGEYLIDDGNCLLFPPGEAAALARAVQRLADDAALRQRLVTGGLETARALGVDELSEALERWHVAAAERFRHGRPAERAPIRVAAP